MAYDRSHSPTTYIVPRFLSLHTNVMHCARVLDDHRGTPGIFKLDLEQMCMTIQQPMTSLFVFLLRQWHVRWHVPIAYVLI